MEQQKTVIELLTDPVESTRVQTMADLLFHVETYARNVSLMIGGLMVRPDASAETIRDLLGIRQSLDELGIWLKGHHDQLYSRLQPAPVTEQVVMVKDGKVIH